MYDGDTIGIRENYWVGRDVWVRGALDKRALLRGEGDAQIPCKRYKVAEEPVAQEGLEHLTFEVKVVDDEGAEHSFDYGDLQFALREGDKEA